MSKKQLSLAGATFGNWKVLADAPSRRLPCGSLRRHSLCECACGTHAIVDNSNLRTGVSTRCVQCGLVDSAKAHITHGLHGTKSYETWRNMMRRATQKDYGGRGITVCERWATFTNFFADMGEVPDGLEIERIDNDRGYSPDNCKWATPLEQARNTRRNLVLVACGVRGCFAELCERFHISYSAAFARWKRGWSADRIFSTPVRASLWRNGSGHAQQLTCVERACDER
jgi:hypothetical protein